LKSRENYKYKKGIEGLSEHYYDNGQLETKGYTKDGEQHGLYEKYDEEGKLIEKEEYEDGKLIKDYHPR
jgi:antitoxin component YwqK of YwqJK toxin-antitoxin module